MALSHVRSLLVEITGRTDLDPATNAAYYKNIDFYINQGQKLLDTSFDNPKSLARRTIALGQGAFFKHLRGCRVIKEIWFANADARTQLTMRNADFLRKNYSNLYGTLSTTLTQGLLATADSSVQGTPLYFMPMTIGLAPEQADDDGFVYDNDGVMAGDHWAYNGVMILPAGDAAGTLSVLGKWYSPSLQIETDKSYWTEVRPEVLCFAAAHIIETMYRNTEGAKDWWNSVMNAMAGVDADLAEQASEGVYNFEGMDQQYGALTTWTN